MSCKMTTTVMSALSRTTTLLLPPLLLSALLLLLLPPPASGLCPSQCRCDGEDGLRVTCREANLTVVPIFLNPGIRTLSVEGNRIQKLEGALGFYESLERLDLSRNELKHVGKGQFSGQKRLQVLDLSGNFLTSLRPGGGAFRGLSALQTLDLSRNVLSVLENGTFAGLDSLVELRMRHNLLARVSPSAFSGLSRLRVLHLESNRLSALSPEWLRPLSSLRFLYASSNRIAALPADVFRPLQALRVVTLARNRLASESLADAFRGSRVLDTVDLAYNLLDEVPSSSLSAAPQLSSLDVSGNPVRVLDRDSFRSLFLLRSLVVSNMTDLDRVAGDAFADNLKLETLRLESNPRLQPLPWGLFASNPALEELSVRGNAWTALSPLQVPGLHSLRRLRVRGLPLHCNCSVLWLWELYRMGENSTVELDEARCASVAASAPIGEEEDEGEAPGGSAGDPLAEMAREQLICRDWSSVLMAVSVSVLVTVLLLVAASLAVYRCRRYRLLRRNSSSVGGSSCLHIKDDTMVYKSTLHPRQYPTPTMRQQQQQHQQQYYVVSSGAGEPAYKPVSTTGGYSPTASSTEPFYEVPKYVTTRTVRLLGSPGHSSGGDESEETGRGRKRGGDSSNKSSSESSGYVVGSELWGEEATTAAATAASAASASTTADLFAGSPAHGYANTGAGAGVNRGAAASQARSGAFFGSPQSTSTGLSSTGSSSNASSTSSSNSANRPSAAAASNIAFFHHSPATMRERGQWFGSPKYSPSSSGFSPQLSPPSPAPGGGEGGNSGSRTLLLHQFNESPLHFANRRQQQHQPQQKRQQHKTGSLRGGGGGGGGGVGGRGDASRKERNLFV